MAKRGITYIKGEEPNFLKKFKEQVTCSGEVVHPVKLNHQNYQPGWATHRVYQNDLPGQHFY